jgi:tetratricopeptide (TPR) repeat protein
MSLMVLSCADKKTNATQIQKADSLFTIQKYKEAKTFYAKALAINKDEKHPAEQIKKIDELLSKKAEDSYNAKVIEADTFFKNKEYNKAKKAYSEASNLKPNETYPKSQISEITNATKQKVKVKNPKPFHIIAGSYEIKNNALGYQKELSKKGIETSLIKSRNGNYLVSLNSMSTITKAYNHMMTLEDDFDYTIWVYKID